MDDKRTHLDFMFTLMDDGTVKDFAGVGKLTPPKEGEKYGYFVEYNNLGEWLDDEMVVEDNYTVLRISVNDVMPTADALFEAGTQLCEMINRIDQICRNADDAELALEKIQTVLRGR